MATSRVLNTRIQLCAALALCAPFASGAPVFTPNDQPFGYAPALALTGFNLSTGTQKAFQTWFDPKESLQKSSNTPVAR